jgi:hypothetical protein
VKIVQEQMGPVFATFFPMTLATLLLIPTMRRERRQQAVATACPSATGTCPACCACPRSFTLRTATAALLNHPSATSVTDVSAGKAAGVQAIALFRAELPVFCIRECGGEVPLQPCRFGSWGQSNQPSHPTIRTTGPANCSTTSRDASTSEIDSLYY